MHAVTSWSLIGFVKFLFQHSQLSTKGSMAVGKINCSWPDIIYTCDIIDSISIWFMEMLLSHAQIYIKHLTWTSCNLPVLLLLFCVCVWYLAVVTIFYSHIYTSLAKKISINQFRFLFTCNLVTIIILYVYAADLKINPLLQISASHHGFCWALSVKSSKPKFPQQSLRNLPKC